ncbi:hypothetical protein EFM45_07300 [Streptococcus thermophilus]|nr:hypothetical protein [Streptococcus thermophilus]
MHIFDLDSHFFEIVGQVFSHFLGQGCNKGAFILFNTGIDFTQKVINLSHSWTDFNFWIQKPISRSISISYSGGGGTTKSNSYELPISVPLSCSIMDKPCEILLKQPCC